MTKLTPEQKQRADAILMIIGWSLISAGATVLFGWASVLILAGLLLAIPARYLKP